MSKIEPLNPNNFYTPDHIRKINEIIDNFNRLTEELTEFFALIEKRALEAGGEARD